MEAVVPASSSEIRSHQFIINHNYDTEWAKVEAIMNGDPDAPATSEKEIFEAVMGEFFDGLHIKTLMTALEPFGLYRTPDNSGHKHTWKTEIQGNGSSLKDTGRELWTNVQDQEIVKGVGRPLIGGGKKKLKINRLYKKRRNTKRRNTKRKNTKRRNTKRRNTKRRNTKRRNTKRRV